MNRSTALLAIVMLSGCADSAAEMEQEPTVTTATEIKAGNWEAIASRRVFFGHQSVGRNIMEGVKEVLAEHPEVAAKLVTNSDAASVPGAAFIDANIGRNGDPLLKTREFAAAVATGLQEQGGIALHKYCYVDVNENTDIPQLFAAYRDQMRTIREAHPQIRLVHVTMPLTVKPERSMKDRVKLVLGREVAPDLNVKRNHFNRLLRAEYAGKEPIFDLATLEATGSDGRKVAHVEGGDTVFSMAPEWTYDGGHLNEQGRKRVAIALLNFLSELD
jgi:hypothetical protein